MTLTSLINATNNLSSVQIELFVYCDDGTLSEIDYKQILPNQDVIRSNSFRPKRIYTDLLLYLTFCVSELSMPTTSDFFNLANIGANKIGFSTDLCSASVCSGKNKVTAIYIHEDLICCLNTKGSCLAALYLDEPFGGDAPALRAEPGCDCTPPVGACPPGYTIPAGGCPDISIFNNTGQGGLNTIQDIPGGCTGSPCDEVKPVTPIIQASFTGCPQEMKLELLNSISCFNSAQSLFSSPCDLQYLHDSMEYTSLAPGAPIRYGFICMTYENYSVPDRIFIVCGRNRYSKASIYNPDIQLNPQGASDCINNGIYNNLYNATNIPGSKGTMGSGQQFPVPDTVMQLPLFGATEKSPNSNSISCPANSEVGHFSPPSGSNGGYFSFRPFHAKCSMEGQDVPTCSIYHLAMAMIDYVSDRVTFEFVNTAPIFSLLQSTDPLGFQAGQKSNVIHVLEQLAILGGTTSAPSTELNILGQPIPMNLVTPKIFYWDPGACNSAVGADKWKHIYHIGERNVILDTGCIATVSTKKRMAYVDNIVSNLSAATSNPYRLFAFMGCAGDVNSNLTFDIDSMGCASACSQCNGGCVIDSGTGSSTNNFIDGTTEEQGNNQRSISFNPQDTCGSAPPCSGVWFDPNGNLIDCGGTTTVQVNATNPCGCQCAPADPSVNFTYDEISALANSGCIVPSSDAVTVCLGGYPENVYSPVFANNNTSCSSLWDEIACGCACLAFGTKVLMSDGTEKNVENIRVGDVVLGVRFGSSVNQDTSTPDNNIISQGWIAPPINDWIFIPASVAQVQIGYEQERFSIGSLSASFEHPILVKDGNNFRFRSISIISSDYFVVDRNMQQVRVSEVVRQVRPTMTVALSLTGAHALVAGGIIVHDGGIPASSTSAESGIALSSGIDVDPCSKNLVI